MAEGIGGLQTLKKSNLYPAKRSLSDMQMGGGGDIKGFPALKNGNKNNWSGLGSMFSETVGPLRKTRSPLS